MHMITEKQLRSLKQWFADYVRPFRENSEIKENIELKIEHTQRVCDEMRMIGEDLSLDIGAMRFAEILARFHDIGRFEQYQQYKTFADALSVDHARFGVDILRKEGVLNLLRPETRDLAYTCISYHNRASLPKDDDEECLFFSQMLRDADKLDIWRVVLAYYQRTDRKENKALQLGLPDTPGISKQVQNDILGHRIVKTDHLKNLNDFKLLQAGWVFDCNFPVTIRAVRDRGYIEALEQQLPKNKETTSIFDEIRHYLDDFDSTFIIDKKQRLLSIQQKTHTL